VRILLLATALSFVAAASANAATLRIAAVNGTSGACHVLPGSAPAGEKAYYQHLANRLGRDIQECPFANEAAAAQGLAAGQVDMALLDPASYGPVRTKTRAILTVRKTGALNRIPIVVVTKANSTRVNIPALHGGGVVYAGRTPAALSVPQQALADQGASPGFFSHEDVATDADAAAAKLRAGGADAMVLNAAAWQRLCHGDRPKDDRCADLKVIWHGRPQAAKAIVIRRDTPDELRFRLIGIHIAMYLEAKDAFAWAASWAPGAAEFEPTEADALAVAAR
jgi:ABC-type phosphate/phosphonate transport system substrate-binding protein